MVASSILATGLPRDWVSRVAMGPVQIRLTTISTASRAATQAEPRIRPLAPLGAYIAATVTTMAATSAMTIATI